MEQIPKEILADENFSFSSICEVAESKLPHNEKLNLVQLFNHNTTQAKARELVRQKERLD